MMRHDDECVLLCRGLDEECSILHSCDLCDGVNAAHSLSTLDLIMAYEAGETTDAESLVLYSRLVKSGMAGSLQGFYGRAAKQLIDQGLLSPEGNILCM